MQITKNVDGTYNLPMKVGLALRGAFRMKLAADGMRFTETKATLTSLFILRGLTLAQLRDWQRWVENINLADGPAAGVRHPDGSYSGTFTVKGRHRRTLQHTLIESGYTFWVKTLTMRTTTFSVEHLTHAQFYSMRAEVKRVNGIQ